MGYCFGNYALTTNEGIEDTGEPFFICIEEENNYYVGYYLTLSFYTEQTECTIKIEELVPTVHKLDSKFIKYAIDAGTGENSIISNDTSDNKASGRYSHAEGLGTNASGEYSHSEGSTTVASGDYSHAEGNYSRASGEYSHAEGTSTTASGKCSHAEGNQSTASGKCSHAEGKNTIASRNNQHVQGCFNIEDTDGKYAHIVGNGDGTSRRSNAHTLDWEGNAWFAGMVEGTAIILKSTTSGSNKRFKITVDDTGTLFVKQF